MGECPPLVLCIFFSSVLFCSLPNRSLCLTLVRMMTFRSGWFASSGRGSSNRMFITAIPPRSPPWPAPSGRRLNHLQRGRLLPRRARIAAFELIASSAVLVEYRRRIDLDLRARSVLFSHSPSCSATPLCSCFLRRAFVVRCDGILR